MPSIHAFQTDRVLSDEDGLLAIEESVNYWYWLKPEQPSARGLADAGYFAEVEDANADGRDDLAITQYEMDVPEDIYDLGLKAVGDWMEEIETNWFPGATIVRQNDTAERLRADHAERERREAEAERVIAAEERRRIAATIPFWNFNDCRDEMDMSLPATHWAYQMGGTWVATVNETPESWFDRDFLEGFVSQNVDRLMRPIEKVPTSGTLCYWDHEGRNYLVPAAAYEPSQNQAA